MHGEDSVSYVELVQAALEKIKPRSEVMKDLMCRTFPNRWENFVKH